MPTPIVPLADVLRAVEAWHQALDDGWPAPETRGGTRTAISEAAERMGFLGDNRRQIIHRLDVASLLGHDVREWTVRMPPERHAAIRRDYASAARRDGVPLSEDQRKFHPDWTAADCIAELQRIAQIDTDKVITRNYFRVNSDISESTWNRYFGTFEEFKRQSEITLSRHAHRMERDIAKHASVDKMRVLNVGKREWEGAYLRPSSRRWQTVLVLSNGPSAKADGFALPFKRRALQVPLPRPVPPTPASGC